MNTTKKTTHCQFEWRKFTKVALILIAVFCSIYLTFQFLLSQNYIIGPSMQPNFYTGNHVISVRHAKVQRGDVIILRAPDEKGKLYVKRVIGMPGDTLVSKNGTLYINGKLYKETFLKQAGTMTEPMYSPYADMPFSYTYSFSISSLAETEDWKKFYDRSYLKRLQKSNRIPQNNYFVMGDHRTVSKDSREIGFITRQAVVGKVAVRYWPLRSFTWY